MSRITEKKMRKLRRRTASETPAMPTDRPSLVVDSEPERNGLSEILLEKVEREEQKRQRKPKLKAYVERYKAIISFEKALMAGAGSSPIGCGTITFEVKDTFGGLYCAVTINQQNEEKSRAYVHITFDQIVSMKKIVDECFSLMEELVE